MFGSIMAAPDKQESPLALAMFSVVNATFGTGIASLATPTAYDVTKCLMSFYNGDTTNNRQRIVLDQISLRATQVNTSGTSYHLQFVRRTGETASGGTALTPVQMNEKATTLAANRRATIATVRFGALTGTAAAATTDWIIWRDQVRDVIFAADDTLHLFFGEGTHGTHGATTSGTCKVVRIPPIIVWPGETLQIHELSPSSTDDPAFEVSACWFERPAP